MRDTMKVLEISPKMLGYIREAMADDLPGQRINANLEREVCPECSGDGTTWHGWGGRDALSFSGDEWAELDEDERDGYMSGPRVWALAGHQPSRMKLECVGCTLRRRLVQ